MKTIKGDLIKLAIDGKFDVIVHGANCFCTFGAGIAKQISKHFPQAYEADLKTKRGDINKLGTISVGEYNISLDQKLYIVNAYTQYKYGGQSHGVIDVDYNAVGSCFREIKKRFTGKKIAFPKIGAGLAGGEWEIITKIINTELEGENFTLVEYYK